MIRRVGFNNERRNRPVARPSASDNTPPTDMPSDKSAGASNLRFEPPRIMALLAAQKKPVVWLIIGFLSLWLAGWTLGIVFMAVMLLVGGMDGEGSFPLIWLGFASVAWVFVVWMLFWLIRGSRAARKQGEERGA